jgi:outer membrane immunogenic protein
MVAAPAAGQDRPFDWSGFYIGGGAGYAWGGVNHTFSPGGSGFGPASMWSRDDIGGSFSNPTNFGLYGAHVGYLQQWDRLVGGIEGSFDLSDMNATTFNAFGELTPGTSYNNKLKWLATLTPRVGYAWNQFQFYAKAGVAMGRVASTLTADAVACLGLACSFSAEATHVGWTAGAGMAYALTSNWILGLEYDYYDLGLEKYGGQVTPDNSWNVAYQLQPRFSALRARVSYRFGAPPAPEPTAAVTAPTVAQPSWQGFYLGANVGYGWSSFAYRSIPDGSGNGGSSFGPGLFFPDAAGGNAFQAGSGGLYGLHAGFNQQWDNLVAGIDLTVSLSDLSAQTSNMFGTLASGGSSHTTSLKWLATLAPRVGISWDRFLVFAKGGLAVGRLSSQLNSSSTIECFAGGFGALSTCSFYEERTHIGVVVGGGLQYQFTPNWSVGLEYNYMDFSTEQYGGTISPNTTWPLSYSVHPQIQTVTGRLTYRL